MEFEEWWKKARKSFIAKCREENLDSAVMESIETIELFVRFGWVGGYAVGLRAFADDLAEVIERYEKEDARA